eukprot:6672598-Pyramimonas_sp.AAC.1
MPLVFLTFSRVLRQAWRLHLTDASPISPEPHKGKQSVRKSVCGVAPIRRLARSDSPDPTAPAARRRRRGAANASPHGRDADRARTRR